MRKKRKGEDKKKDRERKKERMTREKGGKGRMKEEGKINHGIGR